MGGPGELAQGTETYAHGGHHCRRLPESAVSLSLHTYTPDKPAFQARSACLRYKGVFGVRPSCQGRGEVVKWEGREDW